jgi:hypothetical protein
VLLWVRLILFFSLLLTLAETKSSAVAVVPTAVKVCQLFVFSRFLASLLLPVYHAADVPAVACVPTVVNIPFICVSTSFLVLLLFAFPAVPILSCAALGPAVLVVLTAVNVPGI